jgi:ubiquinone/menaquinone biosynthesis C-methylase UbiE
MRNALPGPDLLRVYDRVAPRYDAQHGLLTARSDQRGRRLLVETAVRAGDRVLDCGAGTGSTALLAASDVGDGGSVACVDVSPGMSRVARERAEAAGLANRMTFELGDLLRLPYADGSFDVALSTYSLCPVGDPRKGALEMLRVVRPGGLVGIAHSAEPTGAVTRWLADVVESVVWHFPSISLGCRSVEVLPALEEAGCRVRLERKIGIPLWPFAVFVVEKP